MDVPKTLREFDKIVRTLRNDYSLGKIAEITLKTVKNNYPDLDFLDNKEINILVTYAKR